MKHTATPIGAAASLYFAGQVIASAPSLSAKGVAWTVTVLMVVILAVAFNRGSSRPCRCAGPGGPREDCPTCQGAGWVK